MTTLGNVEALEDEKERALPVIIQESPPPVAGKLLGNRQRSEESEEALQSVLDMITKTGAHLRTKKEIDRCLENAPGQKLLRKERDVQAGLRHINVLDFLLSPILWLEAPVRGGVIWMPLNRIGP